MAASIIGQVLSRSTSLLFRQELITCQRVLTNYQPTRGIRRTCHPPKWFVKRRGPSRNVKLTKENREFIDQLAEETYASPTVSPLRELQDPVFRGNWDKYTRRTGLLTIKLGQIPQWTSDGKKFITTILQVLDNHVINYIPPEIFAQSSGYKPKYRGRFGSCVVGALNCYPHQFTKEYNNLFATAGVPPKRKLTRFIVTPDAKIEPGTPLTAMHYRVGDYVDVQAKTIGHGFQGVVKRWKFKGGPRSHGVTKAHRRTGNISRGNVSRVLPGKKMPGHMGMKWNTTKGLKIWRINTKYNVLYVNGAFAGPNHCYVRVMDTVLNGKKTFDDPPPMPTFFPEDTTEKVSEEYFDKNLFQFTQPSLKYEEEKKQRK